MDKEIKEFLVKNIIEPSNSDPGEIISPIFIRPKKKSCKVRLIFNLKHLKDAVTYRKFKMDALDAEIASLTTGCFMTSIDLRDAYYRVPIKPEHRNNLNVFGEEYCTTLLFYPWVSAYL